METIDNRFLKRCPTKCEQREARNAGSALGAVVGITAGLALGIDDDTEDIENDDYEDVEEDEGFNISM